MHGAGQGRSPALAAADRGAGVVAGEQPVRDRRVGLRRPEPRRRRAHAAPARGAHALALRHGRRPGPPPRRRRPHADHPAGARHAVREAALARPLQHANRRAGAARRRAGARAVPGRDLAAHRAGLRRRRRARRGLGLHHPAHRPAHRLHDRRRHRHAGHGGRRLRRGDLQAQGPQARRLGAAGQAGPVRRVAGRSPRRARRHAQRLLLLLALQPGAGRRAGAPRQARRARLVQGARRLSGEGAAPRRRVGPARQPHRPHHHLELGDRAGHLHQLRRALPRARRSAPPHAAHQEHAQGPPRRRAPRRPAGSPEGAGPSRRVASRAGPVRGAPVLPSRPDAPMARHAPAPRHRTPAGSVLPGGGR